MSTLTVGDGTLIHYEVTGRGDPPLVFVHGWCSNLGHWNHQVRHFAPSHRTIAVDRRGHGQSSAPAEGYTASQHSADLAELLAAERVTAAVMVGHAGGCPGVLELARSHPATTSALVLIDTRLGTGGGRGLEAMVERLSGPDGEADFAEIYAAFFSAQAAALAAAAVDDAQMTPPHARLADLASLDLDTVSLAGQLTQPVLWLTATAADEEGLAAIFNDVSFGRVVGSGHFPQLEVPDQVNSMIERFVALL